MKILKSIFAFFLLLLIGSSVVLWYISNQPIGVTDTPTTFVVGQDESTQNVIRRLAHEGHVVNQHLFSLVRWIRHGGDQSEFAPGGYTLRHNMNMWDVDRALSVADSVVVTLPAGLEKRDLADYFGDALGWVRAERISFVRTLALMQWNEYNEPLIDIVAEKLSWNDTEVKAFATMSAFFSDEEYDFLKDVYMPGEYLIDRNVPRSQLANILIERTREAEGDDRHAYLDTNLDATRLLNVSELIRGEVELMPDLIPLPPSDLAVEWRNSEKMLIFTTTYWNQGNGPLELVADPATREVEGDVERDIYQRIYRIDGDFRDHLAGNFLWHQEHLHYHYDDFVDYYLEPVDIATDDFVEAREKATFCVRDTDSIDTDVTNAVSNPGYRVCGKERQGISVGWGDSYYFTYPDQSIPIAEVPKGTYKLVFDANPRRRFEEITYDNNVSSVLIELDPENETVEILEIIET